MNVEELLRDKKIPFTPKGRDFIVSCLSPDHPDKNPSMRIDQITGIYNCFSCGYKGNLFTLYGEAANELEQRRQKMKRLIEDKMQDTIGLSFPKSMVSYTGNWREIRPETYKHFEAFQSHEPDHIGRIVFPIRDISGRIRAFVGRHTTGETPKYYFTPQKAKLPIYPPANPVKGSIVLVEGIYDMLNLYDKGVRNASCIFGTNNIGEKKLKLAKMQGVEHIFVFLDGDDAGQKAAEKIKVMCEEAGLQSTNVHLKGKDPGELTESQVKKLKIKFHGE